MEGFPLSVATIVLLATLAGCLGGDDPSPQQTGPGAGPAASDGPFFVPPALPTDALPGASLDHEGPQLPPAVTLGTLGLYHKPNQTVLGLEPRAVGGSFHTGVPSVEPTIGVDSQGNVFLGGFGNISLTQDKGQSWTEIYGNLAGVNLHAPSFDPYVYVDQATDRVYHLDIAPSPGFLSLSWTDDLGETWTHNPEAAGQPNANDHPSIVAASPRLLPTVGYPNVVHICVNNAVYTACTASLDGGLTFRPQIPIYTMVEANDRCPGGDASVSPLSISNGQTGHLRSGQDGTLYIPTARCFAGGNGFPILTVSKDDGLTFTHYPITQDPAFWADDHDVDVAIDADNVLYASWNSRGRQVLSRSADGGATWSEPFITTAPTITGTAFNAIGALGPGLVAVAYLGTQVPDGYANKEAGTGGLVGDVTGEPDPPSWAEAHWHAILTLVDMRDPENPVMLSVTGNTIADPLARGLCGRTRCHGMTDFIDLAVDAEGRPWAAFVDVCTRTCVTDPTVHWDNETEGLAVTLLSGPSLLDGLALAALAPEIRIATAPP